MLGLLAAVQGCTHTAKPVNLPPPHNTTTLGVGDVFELRIVGEEKVPTQFKVASDGTVMLPLAKRVKVVGLEPQQIEDAVVQRLKDEGQLLDPVVTVKVIEYNSKRIDITGEVQKSGSFPLEPNMSLMRLIALAGGFNSMARKSHVTVRRQMPDGSVTAVEVNVEDIMANAIPDVPLQAGDSVTVPQRVY
ncbi:MAG: polysaccharide export protein [Polyangiaceae bacterium]|nr:polysaccharide export protein [Polyangiaceae bacterium]